MKVSELISKLEKIKKADGDIHVTLAHRGAMKSRLRYLICWKVTRRGKVCGYLS